MIKKYLECGKFVGTHGVKGMLRAQLWCDSADFLKQFKKIYIDENGENSFDLISAHEHGNVALISLKKIDTIELAESLRNKVFYIERAKAKLPKDRYFIADLIGCDVFDADSEEKLGILTEVSSTGANDVWHIKKDNKEYLVPAIESVIVEVNPEENKVVIRPIKGIFDDED